MFHLHETTERKLCRVAFIAICIAPTLLLLAYALRLHMPGYRAAVASELTQAAGVDVSLDDLVHPRPGHTRLTNVRLCDPETGGQIAHLRELEIVDDGERVVLHAAQPKLDARHWDLLVQRLEERVLRATPAKVGRIELHAADVTITSPQSESQTLRHVVLAAVRENDATVLQIHYRVAGVSMPEPATLRLARKTSGDGQASLQLAWHTGGAALPVAPWAAKFPWLKAFGARCRFRGEITAEQTASGWRGQLGGELSRIDLDQLVSNQFPHKLSGEGRLVVEQLCFDRDRIASARGRIEAGPGVVGQSLVASAVEHLSMQRDGEHPANLTPVTLRRYSQLALDFSLDEKSLTLRGECTGAPQSTAFVIADEQYRVSPEISLSPLALVRVLSPASDHQVPATKATRSLIQVLPLPEEVLPADDGARGHVRGT